MKINSTQITFGNKLKSTQELAEKLLQLPNEHLTKRVDKFLETFPEDAKMNWETIVPFDFFTKVKRSSHENKQTLKEIMNDHLKIEFYVQGTVEKILSQIKEINEDCWNTLTKDLLPVNTQKCAKQSPKIVNKEIEVVKEFDPIKALKTTTVPNPSNKRPKPESKKIKRRSKAGKKTIQRPQDKSIRVLKEKIEALKIKKSHINSLKKQKRDSLKEYKYHNDEIEIKEFMLDEIDAKLKKLQANLQNELSKPIVSAKNDNANYEKKIKNLSIQIKNNSEVEDINLEHIRELRKRIVFNDNNFPSIKFINNKIKQAVKLLSVKTEFKNLLDIPKTIVKTQQELQNIAMKRNEILDRLKVARCINSIKESIQKDTNIDPEIRAFLKNGNIETNQVIDYFKDQKELANLTTKRNYFAKKKNITNEKLSQLNNEIQILQNKKQPYKIENINTLIENLKTKDKSIESLKLKIENLIQQQQNEEILKHQIKRLENLDTQKILQKLAELETTKEKTLKQLNNSYDLKNKISKRLNLKQNLKDKIEGHLIHRDKADRKIMSAEKKLEGLKVKDLDSKIIKLEEQLESYSTRQKEIDSKKLEREFKQQTTTKTKIPETIEKIVDPEDFVEVVEKPVSKEEQIINNTEQKIHRLIEKRANIYSKNSYESENLITKQNDLKEELEAYDKDIADIHNNDYFKVQNDNKILNATINTLTKSNLSNKEENILSLRKQIRANKKRQPDLHTLDNIISKISILLGKKHRAEIIDKLKKGSEVIDRQELGLLSNNDFRFLNDINPNKSNNDLKEFIEYHLRKLENDLNLPAARTAKQNMLNKYRSFNAKKLTKKLTQLKVKRAEIENNLQIIEDLKQAKIETNKELQDVEKNIEKAQILETINTHLDKEIEQIKIMLEKNSNA